MSSAESATRRGPYQSTWTFSTWSASTIKHCWRDWHEEVWVKELDLEGITARLRKLDEYTNYLKARNA